jgi:lipopolysaccharide export system permease protein
LRGIGVGYGRLLRVPYAYTVPLAIINLLIVGYLQPYTEYRYESLRFDLNSGALGAAIKVGEFNRLGKRLTLRIDRSENKGTQLHGIFVETDDGKGDTVAATAQHGRFFSTSDPDKILFRLNNARLIQNSPKFSTPRTGDFGTYDFPISLPAIAQFRGRGGTQSSELYLHELWRVGDGGGTTDEHQRVEAQANFDFRIVEVLMMFMLPLLAVSLAVPPKRSSSGLGIFVAILVVVAYHKVNQYGQQMGVNGQMDPILSLGVPLVLFAAMIGWMYHVLAHRPGGQPIGALERFFARIASLARSVMPRRNQAPAEA